MKLAKPETITAVTVELVQAGKRLANLISLAGPFGHLRHRATSELVWRVWYKVSRGAGRAALSEVRRQVWLQAAEDIDER